MPTVAEIAASVGGEFPPDAASVSITAPAALASAQSGEIAFFAHPRYASDLRTTRASAVLVPKDFDGETPAVCIRVDNPSAAFTKVTEAFLPAMEVAPPGVHPRVPLSVPGLLSDAEFRLAKTAFCTRGLLSGNIANWEIASFFTAAR